MPTGCNSSGRSLNCRDDATALADLEKLHRHAILTSREELSELLRQNNGSEELPGLIIEIMQKQWYSNFVAVWQVIRNGFMEYRRRL